MSPLRSEACPRHESSGFLSVPGSPPASSCPGGVAVSSPRLTPQTESSETTKQQVMGACVNRVTRQKRGVVWKLRRQMDGDVRGRAGNTAPSGHVTPGDARSLDELPAFLSWGILEA